MLCVAQKCCPKKNLKISTSLKRTRTRNDKIWQNFRHAGEITERVLPLLSHRALVSSNVFPATNPSQWSHGAPKMANLLFPLSPGGRLTNEHCKRLQHMLSARARFATRRRPITNRPACLPVCVVQSHQAVAPERRFVQGQCKHLCRWLPTNLCACPPVCLRVCFPIGQANGRDYPGKPSNFFVLPACLGRKQKIKLFDRLRFTKCVPEVYAGGSHFHIPNGSR